MATFEIKMPKLGESITEGTIMTWSVKAGDVINEDDILFEVSTAKVSAEIPSPVAGKILQILFKEGDTVSVGTVVAIVQLEVDSEEEAPEVGESTTAKEEAPASSAEPVKNVKSEESRWYSPIVLQIAQEAQLSKEELDSIPGTGYEGRLSKKDIKTYVEQRKKGVQPAALAAPQKTVSAEPALVSPQKVASAEPAFVAPSKPVTVPQPVAAESKPAPSTPVIPVSDGDEVVEMDFVRRIIADHMAMSKQVSPHVTTVVEVDVTKLVRWRERNKESFQRREGISLTYMPAIVEAVTKALAEYPYVNASVDGYRMILKKKINVGVAVSLNDGNLIVPVIHNADKLSLSGLAGSIDTLAAKARANKLSPDDIQGGTFTITNFGTFKNIIGTPIINQPQVAILGVGYIEKKPAVVETLEGDTIAIRHKMYLSLSYDHRIVNGAMGGAFLRRIADYLENWNG
jgi:Pyruvate/2-oxoglutarate dehydrogenase complex, dihydrolipoamide acyltransferase (E2) component, and related enzymes